MQIFYNCPKSCYTHCSQVLNQVKVSLSSKLFKSKFSNFLYLDSKIQINLHNYFKHLIYLKTFLSHWINKFQILETSLAHNTSGSYDEFECTQNSMWVTLKNFEWEKNVFPIERNCTIVHKCFQTL